MKKKIAVLTLGVVMAVGVPATVMAADDGVISSNGLSGRGGSYCQHYVDADGDGICDNHGSGQYFVDADGDGVCDNRGDGKYFVDANGDGICDHQSNGMTGNGHHGMAGHHGSKHYWR